MVVFGLLACGPSLGPPISDDLRARAAAIPEGSARDYVLVATGQTQTYATTDAITPPARGQPYFGQDAQFESVPMRYEVDQAQKVVTDVNTGLKWERSPEPTHLTWTEAWDRCTSLDFAGHQDWRVPSAKELFSISDFSRGWPYLDSEVFDLADTPIDKDEQYWTRHLYAGTTWRGGPDAAFGVNHATGHIKAYPARAGGARGKRSRCVRGPAYGINRLVDNRDGTITDDATRRMWTKADSGVGMNWLEALKWVEQMNEAQHLGYADWRMPDVKELQSLVDYGRAPDATNVGAVGPAIDPVFDCTPVKNEAGNSDFAYYWTGTSARFGGEDTHYPYAWYVAFGRSVNSHGQDVHGAGAVRFDSKVPGGPHAEGTERVSNLVRLVRTSKVTRTTYGTKPVK